MADINSKLPQNVPGTFYVDTNCISCGQCVDTAPDFFTENPESGTMYVKKQPSTADEISICNEAKSNCPVEAIGDDGE